MVFHPFYYEIFYGRCLCFEHASIYRTTINIMTLFRHNSMAIQNFDKSLQPTRITSWLINWAILKDFGHSLTQEILISLYGEMNSMRCYAWWTSTTQWPHLRELLIRTYVHCCYAASWNRNALHYRKASLLNDARMDKQSLITFNHCSLARCINNLTWSGEFEKFAIRMRIWMWKYEYEWGSEVRIIHDECLHFVFLLLQNKAFTTKEFIFNIVLQTRTSSWDSICQIWLCWVVQRCSSNRSQAECKDAHWWKVHCFQLTQSSRSIITQS